MLNGHINGVVSIVSGRGWFIFRDAFFDEHDHIPDVDPARANQHTFAAEHTFFNFRFEFNRFATPQQQIHPPDIKTNQIVGAAGGRASSARQANLKRRFQGENLVQHATVELIVIDGALLNEGEPEVFHG